MSDENDRSDGPSADADEQTPLCGERLAEARRERQISVLEVAKELHLDEAKVRALENNEFDSLGAPVFAKGHLRKYSHLVGVDHDDVLADYYRLTRSQEIPPVVTRRRKPDRELSPGPWIAAISVIVVVAIAYWFVVRYPLMQDDMRDRPAPAAQAPETSAVDAIAADEVDIDELAGADPEPEAAVEEQPEPSPADTPEVSTAPPAALAEGEVRLSMTFVGECWTEISDASGRRLFFNLGREGQTVDVSGQAPVSVLFGDADNVSLQVNGDDFTIADADRRGRTARLIIYGT